MSINKKIYFLTAILFGNITIFCQYSSNSPYSRYGIGDIDRSGFGLNRALGGLSIGLRQPNQINFLNPASYNSQDTMSFIWDIGLFGNFTTSSTSQGQSSRHSVNFDHLAMSFPVAKWYFVSAGLVPFSNMGYNIREITDDPETGGINNLSYVGSGNLNQFYFGNAFTLLKNKLNVGFNVSYIFGSLNVNNSIEYYEVDNYGSLVPSSSQVSTFIEKKYMAKGLYFNFGIQGIKELSNGSKIIVGMTFDPKTRINLDYTDYLIRTPSYYDTINKIDTSGNFTIPARIGFGLSLSLKDKLLLGFDFTTQNWNKSTFLGESQSLKSNNKLSFGMQYTPNSGSYRSYFDKINYRIGGYYNDTYLIMNGTPIKDYGISFGLGLPFKNSGTMFNIAVELGTRGTKSNNLVQINYSRITLSLSLFDFWFIKRKYD